MRFCSSPLGAALAMAAIAAVTMASPGRAQQDPGAGQQLAPPPVAPPPGAAPEVKPPDGPPPRHVARRRLGGAAVVSAKVNLRSGPGTASEILATIPVGSTVGVGSCEGEWCQVTWNGQSGYAIERNLNRGGSRQAGVYPGQPGYQPEYPDEEGLPGYAPRYYGPPVVYGPAYYYGPRVYYGPGWGWRRSWW
jgi:uncharacterized protein YraI